MVPRLLVGIFVFELVVSAQESLPMKAGDRANNPAKTEQKPNAAELSEQDLDKISGGTIDWGGSDGDEDKGGKTTNPV